MFYVALICGAGVVVFLGGLRLWVEHRYRARIYDCLEDVPLRPVAIVLGAGLWPDGSITPALADRVATAADLYHTGVVQTLLFSGARRPGYDEPQVMLNYAVGLGIPEEAVVLDPEGFRTYETCRRAREVYGVEEAVVVTHRFHAARALYLCDAWGIDAIAVVADRRDCGKKPDGFFLMNLRRKALEIHALRQAVWEVRECLALARAVWDVR